MIYKKELALVAIITLAKLLIITLLPLTGDEAYFIAKWATNPSLGYYDHPPMVGWIIYLLSFISDSYIFYRLFALFTSFITAYVIYRIALLYGVAHKSSLYASLIFLASSVDLLLVLMTNDVALLFFSSLGTLALLFALEKNSTPLALLAGFLLGGAFLSKYFAVFLLFALLIFAIFTYKKRSLKTLVIASLIITLAIMLNLYYNYTSCWNNIMFNFFARGNSGNIGITNTLIYFALIVYVVSPWGLYYLIRSKLARGSALNLSITILSVAFVLFLLVSLKNGIGLHWFLLFSPYIYLLFALIKSETQEKIFKLNAIFSLLQATIIITTLLLPIELLSSSKKYADLILYTEAKEVCKHIDSEQFYTFGYTPASQLSYACKKSVYSLFSKSKYGREDDKLLDLRGLDGKDLTIVFDHIGDAKKTSGICEVFDVESFSIKGVDLYKGVCKNFSLEEYGKIYLERLNSTIYNIPPYLPTGDCYFKERYFE